MEAVIIAAGVIAAVWAITKTGAAIRTLREQRRHSPDGREDRSGDRGSYGVGGIDPGGGHGCQGHGGGDCGGHGGGHGGS
jgi:hypothetical protein